MALPLNPADGDKASIGSVKYVYEAATDTWLVGGDLTGSLTIPIGTIIDYTGTSVPLGFLLCDGSTFDGNIYRDLAATLGSTTLPDMRDMFTRGSPDPDNLDQGFPQQQDTTRRPRNNNFTGTARNAGNHSHGMHWMAGNTDSNWAWSDAVFALADNKNPQGQSFNKRTRDAGNHSHSVDITGGGDSETAPKHVYVVKIIKAAASITATGTPVAATPGVPASLYHQATAPTGIIVDGSVWSEPNGAIHLRRQGVWQPLSSGMPTGTVIDFSGSVLPAGYQLCDGSEAQTDALSQVLGGGTGIGNRANVPDLRNMFVRGANTMADVDPGTKHQDTTRRPRNQFTGTAQNGGDHKHRVKTSGEGSAHWQGGGWPGGLQTTSRTGWSDTRVVNNSGPHSHHVDITGGGDAETAPKHVILAKIIKL